MNTRVTSATRAVKKNHSALWRLALQGELLCYVLGIMLQSVKDLLESVLGGQLYRIVINLSTGASFQNAVLQILLLTGCLLLVAGLMLAGSALNMKSSARADRRIRSALLHTLCHIQEGTRAAQGLGYWTNLMGRDLDITGESYKTKWPSMAARAVSVAGGILILLTYSFSLTLFCIGCGALYFVLIYSLRARAGRIQKQSFQKLEACSRFMGEMLKGLPVICFYQLKEYFSQKYQGQIHSYLQVGRQNARMSTLAMGLRNFGYSFSYVGILIFGLALVNAGSLSIGDFMYLWSIGIGVVYGMQSLGTQILEYQENQAAIQHIEEALSLPVENGGQEVVTGYDLQWEQVSFGYTEQTPILHQISLQIPRGQKVAIVGASGSGKTTMIRLLLGLYRPTKGDIRVGDVSITQASLTSLRDQLAYLPQSPFLFDETIRENLRYSRPQASEEELEQALAWAGLSDLLSRLPQKLDTVVGPNGSKLSGGERQRLGLARCYLRGANIFIMDEMTSALDAKLEEEIVSRLFSLRDKTVICITHKLAAARLADRILVMDQGRIVEDGSHETLLQQQGVYYRLTKGEEK